MYEKNEDDTEIEESVIHINSIPDDTIDKVMSEIDPESMETNDENKTVGSESTKRLERENEELKKSIDSYKTKIYEMEINVLNSQIEVSALTEEVQQLEDEAKRKDEQNTLLVGEKGSLEIKICEMNSRVTKINGAIHQIFNEKELLRANIEK